MRWLGGGPRLDPEETQRSIAHLSALSDVPQGDRNGSAMTSRVFSSVAFFEGPEVASNLHFGCVSFSHSSNGKRVLLELRAGACGIQVEVG